MLFQFKIQLKHITHPPVWRKVTVPAQFSFAKFHLVIQAAFGWDDYHLYQFSPKGYASSPTIGIPNPDGDFFFSAIEEEDATKVKLSDIFTKEKQKFTYIYDFGDDWIHEITLEKITNDTSLVAACIAGKGACPPEDCGGPWGYMQLKEVFADSRHPEHEEMKEWLGLDEDEAWDAEEFDLEAASESVQQVR